MYGRCLYLLLGAALLLSLPACGGRRGAGAGRHGQVTQQGRGGPLVQAAVKVLQSGAAAKLEIVYLPIEVETITSLGPEGLEQTCYHRITVQHLEEDSRLPTRWPER